MERQVFIFQFLVILFSWFLRDKKEKRSVFFGGRRAMDETLKPIPLQDQRRYLEKKKNQFAEMKRDPDTHLP